MSLHQKEKVTSPCNSTLSHHFALQPQNSLRYHPASYRCPLHPCSMQRLALWQRLAYDTSLRMNTLHRPMYTRPPHEHPHHIRIPPPSPSYTALHPTPPPPFVLLTPTQTNVHPSLVSHIPRHPTPTLCATLRSILHHPAFSLLHARHPLHPTSTRRSHHSTPQLTQLPQSNSSQVALQNHRPHPIPKYPATPPI
jgi:hypothetical protein